jgi:hypothetical protein
VRSGRNMSCRFAIGVAAVVIGLAIVPAGAWADAYTVNTLDDSTATSTECMGVASDCSLRQALAKAKAGDTIVFDVTGKITLTAANGPLQDSVQGLTINGPGASRLAIDGGGIQILRVGAGDLTVTGLTFQNGQATGGSVAEARRRRARVRLPRSNRRSSTAKASATATIRSPRTDTARPVRSSRNSRRRSTARVSDTRAKTARDTRSTRGATAASHRKSTSIDRDFTAADKVFRGTPCYFR